MKVNTKENMKDNFYDRINVEILDNVMEYGKEALQISNITQIRISKEPPRPYSIIAILCSIVCFFGIFAYENIRALFFVGFIIAALMVYSVFKYNKNLKTYLIVEMNSGRIILFSAKSELFLETAKNALLKCFNQRNLQMSINFSDCTVKECAFGENSSVQRG